MADSKILFKIEVDDSGTITALKATQKGFKDLDLTTKNAKNSQEQLNNAMRQMGAGTNLKGIKLTEKEYQKLLKTQGQLKNATGGATASVMELGRVVSDAPYGIRGMANNITQLVSQFGFTAKAAGGFGNALKEMGKLMIGPLGVVFAITTVVSAIDYFYGGTKKAEAGAKTLNDALREGAKAAGESITKFRILTSVLLDKAASDEEQAKALKILNKEFKDFNTKLITNADNYEDAKKAADEYTKSLLVQAKARAAITLIEEKQGKILELEEEDRIAREKAGFKTRKQLDDAIEKQEKRAIENIATTTKSFGVYRAMNLKDLRDSNKEEIKELNNQIENISKLPEIIDAALGVDSGGSNKRKRATLIGDLNIIDPEKTLKQAKKLFKAVASSVGYDAKQIFKEAIPDIVLDDMLTPQEKEAVKAYVDAVKKEISDNAILTDKLDDTLVYSDYAQKAVSAVTSLLSAEYDKQATIEQNKTNALNEELNNRLLNENLSKDERAKIQQQIWQNDENLRKKQESINKKRFENEKKMNIAKALIDTYAAAVGVMKDASGGFFARLSQALPTIAFGLAQVAAISKQTFQSSAASTPIRTGALGGGAGGGQGDRTFDFNLVGNTAENQLANIIQGQFQTPIKAFVVSKDITTQQELDANIKSSASL